MANLPSLRQIEAFVAVAETGSFTRAAERRHMPQSALSTLVRDLEGALGLRLFDRTTRRVELTEGGREFLSAARGTLASLDAACRSARDHAARRRGRIVVAAPPLIAAAILPAAMAAFRETHPDVSLGLLDLRTDEIVEAVREGRAQCGIGTFAESEEGVDQTRLAEDEIAAFGRDLPDAATVPWSDLAARPLVTLTWESGIRALVESGLAAGAPGTTPAFEVAQITTALALADAGLGIAVLPTYAAALAGGLPARRLAAPVVARRISLILRRERSRPPALLDLIGVLKTRVAEFGRSLPA